MLKDRKQQYFALYQYYIKRAGADDLLHYLETQTDFFEAPASTRFHESYDGGLCDHSLKVFQELVRLLKAYPELKTSGETVAVITLLHDICKVNCYRKDLRNVKKDGEWIQVPYYSFQDETPYGSHGGKSVFMIQQYMKLTPEEAVAINCHMGDSKEFFDAYRKYPLAFLLHTADMAATIDFKKED